MHTMWLVFFPQFVFVIQSAFSFISLMKAEIVLQQFLLLGIIPGTNIQLSLNDMLLWVGYVILLYIAYYLCMLAIDTIDRIDPDHDLPPGIRRIDLIAL